MYQYTYTFVPLCANVCQHATKFLWCIKRKQGIVAKYAKEQKHHTSIHLNTWIRATHSCWKPTKLRKCSSVHVCATAFVYLTVSSCALSLTCTTHKRKLVGNEHAAHGIPTCLLVQFNVWVHTLAAWDCTEFLLLTWISVLCKGVCRSCLLMHVILTVSLRAFSSRFEIQCVYVSFFMQYSKLYLYFLCTFSIFLKPFWGVLRFHVCLCLELSFC